MEERAESVDRDEFARLLSRYSRQIFGFILVLSPNRSDAEDIFQETSVELWRKFTSYQPGTNFRAWAYQVAYYEVLDYRRRRGRRQLLDDEAFQVLARDALLLTTETSSQREDALTECLKKIPKADRRLIERRYRMGLTPNQIAEQTSRSVHSVYRALTRIHRALSECISRTLSQEKSQEASR